jgi:hypothetical protein
MRLELFRLDRMPLEFAIAPVLLRGACGAVLFHLSLSLARWFPA